VQQDQKIGLSLAVLLIGFAGAFCFRHEGVPPQPPLTLDGAQQLDQRIEHLPVRAYTELEGVRLPGERGRSPATPDGPLSEAIAPPLAAHIHDRRPDDLRPPVSGPPEPLRVASNSRYIRPTLNIEIEPPFASEQRYAPRPDPQHAASQRGPTPTPSADAHLRDERARTDGESTSRSSSAADVESRPADEPPAVQTYVVRPGDTLSGLAQRFLGSTRRYYELYEANRDVLSDPDTLHPGTVLRIPMAQ
jgi:nucleoid-associated protein YgaU